MVSCYEPKLEPDDFDSFWNKSISELGDNVPFSVIRDSLIDDKKFTLNKIKSYEGIEIYAWVSQPVDSGTYPVFVKFHEFGIGNQNVKIIPSEWFLKQPNHINMVVDIRGQGLSTEKYKFQGYLTKGIQNENSFIYKGAFLDAVKAIDFISQNENSNGKIIASGAGQGGTLALVATALNPKVSLCVANYPFLTDIHGYDKTVWPMKIWIHETNIREMKLEEIYHILSYFDVLNFADRINVPVFIRTQERDTITPKEGAVKLFQKIQGNKKKLYVDPCKGHGCSLNSKIADEMEKAFIQENLLKK
ncbi:MAG TPA: acetylxylan esterase [Mangrovimonas sp.]|nr:acetylxylan esterase [Mangrovimonas sp.]